MEHSGSGSLIAVLASVAIASGATAALATVLAINAVKDEGVRRRAKKWMTWTGPREGVTFEGASAEPCCCSQRSANHLSSSQPPSQYAETCQPDSLLHNSKPLTADQTNSQSRHASREVLQNKPPKNFSERLEELSEREKSALHEENSSIDLRTPEKGPRPLDLSLGEESPVQPGKPDPEDPAKRKGYLSWDDYFMAVAFLSAQRSKDPNRQVGACIVSQERIILGIGYNGFPRGCSDDQLPWAKSSRDGDLLKTKYPYVCHAELNAILNRNHASAPGQKMYVTMFPCNECAKLIIQSGISEVIYYTDKGGHDRDIGPGDPRPEVAYAASKRLLKMAGVKLWQHKPAKASITLEFR